MKRIGWKEAAGLPPNQSIYELILLRRLWRMLRIGLIVLILWQVLAWALAQMLIVTTPATKSDAIFVFSGSAAYLERTQYAASLYRQGYAPQIILTNDNEQSGWSNEQQRNPFFFEREIDSLKAAGVPLHRITVLQPPVSSTLQEAVALKDYAAEHQLQSILVVTSAYHSRRALWTLRRIFRPDRIMIQMNSVPPGQQTPLPALWWFSARGWRTVVTEYGKLIYYFLTV